MAYIVILAGFFLREGRALAAVLNGHSGCTVETADDLEDAKQRVGRTGSPVDIVIISNQAMHRWGEELLECIREESEKVGWWNAPSVICLVNTHKELSSYEERVSRWIELGAGGVIGKHKSPDELLGCIDRIRKERETAREKKFKAGCRKALEIAALIAPLTS